MDKAERYIVAKQQGLRCKVMYERERTGWTDDQIRRGYRTLKDYVPMFELKRNVLKNGAETFLVLIFEVVKSIAKLPDEIDNYLLTCLVYRGLLERAEIERG
jgi:hypothetical protein